MHGRHRRPTRPVIAMMCEHLADLLVLIDQVDRVMGVFVSPTHPTREALWSAAWEVVGAGYDHGCDPVGWSA